MKRKNIRLAVFGLCEEVGGIETYIKNLHRALKDSNIVFDYIMWHDTPHFTYEAELEKDGSHFYRQLYKHREKNKSDYISIKELFDLHPEWDGIYLNVPRIEYLFLLLVEARKRKLPYRILHCHNNARKEVHKKKIYKQLYWNVFYRLNKSAVTHRFACSHAAGENMFGSDDYIVIPNAINFDQFKFDMDVRLEMREKYHIKDDDFVVGFVGRFGKQKNILYIVEIFNCIYKKKKNCYLLLVGEGNQESEIRKKIEAYGLADNVIFAGAHQNTSSFYQMMDCFLFPSLYEGLGIVLLEAQAAGLHCYTALDRVPKESDVTSTIKYLDIDDNPNIWANAIMNQDGNRIDGYEKLLDSKYNISKLAQLFQDALDKETR